MFSFSFTKPYTPRDRKANVLCLIVTPTVIVTGIVDK